MAFCDRDARPTATSRCLPKGHSLIVLAAFLVRSLVLTVASSCERSDWSELALPAAQTQAYYGRDPHGREIYEADEYYDNDHPAHAQHRYVMYETQYYPPPSDYDSHHREARSHYSLDDATALGEKGTSLMRAGKYQDAMQCYDKMLVIQLQILGDQHPIVAQTIDLMGCCFLRLGRHKDAAEALEKALDIYRILGQEGKNVDWALTKMHLGQAHELEAEQVPMMTNRIPEEVNRLTDRAFGEYQSALEVFNVLEREEIDIDVANIMHCMGNLHNLRGEYVAALRRFKLALSDKIQILGEEDASCAWTKNNIANALRGIGKADEAIKVYIDALNTVHRIFGPDHPEVAQVHWNLALAYQEKAEQEAERRKHSWHNWGLFRLFLGRGVRARLAHEGKEFAQMEKHLRHAFEVFERRLGEDHPSTDQARDALMALEQLRRD